MTEAYARPQKISKTELLVTVFIRAIKKSYKKLHFRLHRHPR